MGGQRRIPSFGLRGFREWGGRRRERVHTPRLEPLEGRRLLTMAFDFTRGVGGSSNGTASVTAFGASTDSNGNVVVVGTFYGTVDFDPGQNTPGDTLTSVGGTSPVTNDIFVAKYSPTGGLLWVKQAGDVLGDSAQDVAIDGAGNIYVTGSVTGSVNFGNGQTVNASQRADIFVWKLDPSGSTVWATSAPGNTNGQNQAGEGIAVSSDGNTVAITGFISRRIVNGVEVGTTTQFGATTLAPTGLQEGFVAELNGSGSFVWAKSFAMQSGQYSFGNRVAVDSSGNVISTGLFAGTIDLDPGAGTVSRSSPNTNPITAGADAYLVKLDSSGNYVFGKAFGGASFDAGTGVATDASGNIYTIGRFIGPISGDGVNLTGPNGVNSLYVMKLTSAGAISWQKNLGVQNSNVSNASIGQPSVALDSSGSVYVTGSFTGTAVLGPTTLYSASGSVDVFVARLNSSGTILEASRAGGTGLDASYALGGNLNGSIALVGSYSGSVSFGGVPLPSYGSANIFVSRVSNVTRALHVRDDFDGDGIADLVVFEPSTATFYVSSSKGPQYNFIKQFGQGTLYGGHPVPIVGDFDGDGIADLVVYQPTTSTFYVSSSKGSQYNFIRQFGQGTLYGGDPVPVAGDFDGDGVDDFTVFQRTTATFTIQGSTGLNFTKQFGQGTLYGGNPIPLVADFDGDGIADPTVFQPTTAQFFINGSRSGNYIKQFGQGTLYGGNPIPLAGDFDGDGIADPTVFQPTTSTFYVSSSKGSQYNFIRQFGQGTLNGGNPIPVAADYDGDGIADLTVFQPTTATFFVASSKGSQYNFIKQFGQGSLYGGNPIPVF